MPSSALSFTPTREVRSYRLRYFLYRRLGRRLPLASGSVTFLCKYCKLSMLYMSSQRCPVVVPCTRTQLRSLYSFASSETLATSTHIRSWGGLCGQCYASPQPSLPTSLRSVCPFFHTSLVYQLRCSRLGTPTVWRDFSGSMMPIIWAKGCTL